MFSSIKKFRFFIGCVKREAHDVSFVFVVCQLIKKDYTSCVSCITWNAPLILYIKKKTKKTGHLSQNKSEWIPIGIIQLFPRFLFRRCFLGKME